ncbi:MAG: D-alanine aminotransferase [Parcubacteria group bacterium GW2011_GWB1_43_8]|nr:MAG: D-alanine aminotransferase [Parcubacteria group bacterium GW2011_GWB1_43_8]
MPKKDKNNYCCFNGKIVPANSALICLDDLGILRGYGVFDVMKTVNGKIFLFDEHFKRLSDSADYLGARLPAGKKEIEEAIKKLISKNKIKQASIRIVLTGGRSADAMHFDSKTPTFYILVSEFRPLKEELFKNGVKLATVNRGRDMAEIKTTNYITAVKNINERQKKENFFEIIYVSNGLVLEASTSNFFAFIGGKLVTPKDNILKGITRNLIIKLAKKEFEVEERELKMDELNLVAEAFIAATNKDIVPVVQIDNLKMGDGKPGKNTQKFMQIFEEFVKNY